MTQDKTPIQQAIEIIKALLPSEDRLEYAIGYDAAIATAVIELENLLPTEKEFAGKVFDAGKEWGVVDTKHDYGRASKFAMESTPDKEEFLSKYYKP